MNYRYGFVFKHNNDYVRKLDLSWMEFLTEEHIKTLKIEFEQNKLNARMFIFDDVNANRVEALMNLMRDNKLDVGLVHTAKWKTLPEVPELYE